MFKSWKTSALGFGAGFLNLLANGVTIKQAAFSIVIAAIGAFAKDHNISGK